MDIEIQSQPEKAEEGRKNSLINEITVGGKEGKEHQGEDHMLIRAVPAHYTDKGGNPAQGKKLYEMLGKYRVTLICHGKGGQICEETQQAYHSSQGITGYKQNYCL